MQAKFGKSKYQGNNYRVDTRNQFPGVYRAQVEYTLDPLKRGRVKVRIPQIHGIPGQTDSYLNPIDLPWAEPCFIGAGPDMGQLIVPLAGATVYVMFEAGDPNKPMYIGGVHGVKLSQGKNMGTFDGVPTASQINGGNWTSNGNDEPPLDAFDWATVPNPDPAVPVIYKSRKGHTIFMDDRDEKEKMTMIDRIGQMFGFVSPVQSSYNNTGDQTFQRGTANAKDKTQWAFSKLLDNKAVVFIRDVGQQILRFVSQQGAEKVDLVSNSQSNGNNKQSGVSLAGGAGNAILFSQDQNSNARCYLEVTPSGLAINIVSGGSVVATYNFTSSGMTYTGTLTQGSPSGNGAMWTDGFDEKFAD